jgi:hypothetical protein
MQMTTVSDGLYQFGGQPVGPMDFPFAGGGTWIFVDPVNGADGNSGGKPSDAVATLYAAYNKVTAGKNTTVAIIGDGSTAATARLSLALSAANTAAGGTVATTGTLTWGKRATHLVGVCAPTSIAQRARIAPPTTGTRAVVFNSGNFVSVTTQGNYFSNFSVFCGFATGGTNQIAWTDSGGRNCYNNVDIGGDGDAASAADTGSYSLLVSGSVGENTFYNCNIGQDTTKTADACTVLTLAGGTPRNRFENCVIEAYAGGTACFWVTIGASGIDRYVLFRNCMFTNPVLPASGAAASQMTKGMSINAAAGGTVQLMNPMYYGAAVMDTGGAGLVFSNISAGAAHGGLGVAQA